MIIHTHTTSTETLGSPIHPLGRIVPRPLLLLRLLLLLLLLLSGGVLSCLTRFESSFSSPTMR